MYVPRAGSARNVSSVAIVSSVIRLHWGSARVGGVALSRNRLAHGRFPFASEFDLVQWDPTTTPLPPLRNNFDQCVTVPDEQQTRTIYARGAPTKQRQLRALQVHFGGKVHVPTEDEWFQFVREGLTEPGCGFREWLARFEDPWRCARESIALSRAAWVYPADGCEDKEVELFWGEREKVDLVNLDNNKHLSHAKRRKLDLCHDNMAELVQAGMVPLN